MANFNYITLRPGQLLLLVYHFTQTDTTLLQVVSLISANNSASLVRAHSSARAHTDRQQQQTCSGFYYFTFTRPPCPVYLILAPDPQGTFSQVTMTLANIHLFRVRVFGSVQ